MGRHLSRAFLLQNILKQGDALLSCFSTLLQNTLLGRFEKNHKRVKLNGKHHLVCIDDVNLLGENIVP
jgi:hypothetical protein